MTVDDANRSLYLFAKALRDYASLKLTPEQRKAVDEIRELEAMWALPSTRRERIVRAVKREYRKIGASFDEAFRMLGF